MTDTPLEFDCTWTGDATYALWTIITQLNGHYIVRANHAGGLVFEYSATKGHESRGDLTDECLQLNTLAPFNQTLNGHTRCGGSLSFGHLT